MSTDYRPLKPIRARDLFNGMLSRLRVKEHIKPDETTERKRGLTDGRNYVWVFIDEKGLVSGFTCYGHNVPTKIFTAVGRTFGTYIASEYEHQYWGFDTEEEWRAALNEEARQGRKEFHADLLKYLRGAKHGIRRGTNGMVMARIAKGWSKKIRRFSWQRTWTNSTTRLSRFSSVTM
jgi:hypothetical protein